MVPLLNMQAPVVVEKSRQQQLMAKVSISILVMALPVLYVSFLHVPPSTLFRDTTFWFLMSNSIIVVIAADSGMLFFGSSSSAAAACDEIDDRPFVVSSDVDASMVVVPSDELLLLPVVIIENQASPSLVVNARDDHGDDAVAMNSYAHALIATGQEDVAVALESGEMVVTSGAPSSASAAGQARLTASKSLAREERAARRRRSRSHSHAPLVAAAVPPVQDKSVVVREEKLRRTATEGRPRPAAEADSESDQYARLSDEELNRRVEDFITRFNREIRLQIEKEQA